jgi:hypothetical protein
MYIEVCDLCKKRVDEDNKTEIIIKDHKGITFKLGFPHSTNRKFKGVICNNCLNLLRTKTNPNEQKNE